MLAPLEALADALAKYSGWHDPESAAYQNRNPGALKAFTMKHHRDEAGMRVFYSHMDGYQALLFDLTVKCSGMSRTRLKKASVLRDLMVVYGQPATAADYVAKFLRKAMRDQCISADTPLSQFVEV